MWTYFGLFSIMIMILLWFFQIVFLNSFYEIMKKQNISELADDVIANYGSENFKSYLDHTAFKNSVLIIITDDSGDIQYYSDEHGTGDFWKPQPDDMISQLDKPLPPEYKDFLINLSNTDKTTLSYTVSQTRFDGQTLIYGVKMTNSSLYISAPLPPVGTTIEVLKTQLIYVTLISLIFSIVVGYFIAKKVSEPILEINRQSTLLAKGEYQLEFTRGTYAEINELASTLERTGQELSKIENLRQELIANISHDFRTPLTMIKAYTEMIRDLSGDNPEKREKHLGIILEETGRLTEFVNDILELSSLQSGSLPVEMSVLNLSELSEEVLNRFKPLAEIYPLEFNQEIERDIFVKGDRSLIERVLYNLIGNAVNYTPDQGILTVKLSKNEDMIRFEVLDEGVGIPEDELLHIWDRYYKARNTEDKVKSSGLGLSIVKNILELHHAVYAAENRPSGGSHFWFELKL